MCSWCWGFAPVLDELQQQLPDEVEVKRLLGGLAPDSDQPMAKEMQQMLQKTWQTIEKKIPSRRFNFDFWTACQPRRSTYPACRAVIAAKSIHPSMEEPMIAAIQQGYYQQALNPSEYEVLTDLAEQLGIDRGRFVEILSSTETAQQLLQEIAHSRALGAGQFPSLVIQDGERRQNITVDYRSVTPMLDVVRHFLRMDGRVRPQELRTKNRN